MPRFFIKELSEDQMNQINILSKIPASLNTSSERLTSLLEEALKKFDVEAKIIEVKFVNEDEMRTLNNSFRKIDQPTDILSFPQFPIPGKYQILGSLVISADSVIRKEENIDDVVKHGLLHLLGFDHDDPSNEEYWETAAQKINCKL